MGAGYMYAALAVIPNLFWDVHPAMGHGIYAVWLVQTVEPLLAQVGGGLGFSFIAEAYANFGWPGTPLLFMIMGFLLVRIVVWAEWGDRPARSAMLASFLAFLLFFPRSESIVVFRALLWYGFLPYCMALVLQTYRISRRARRGF